MRRIKSIIELSYDDLILAGIEYFSARRHKIIIPKLPPGFLNHRTDLISIDNWGHLTEIVVKMSIESFKMEFLKGSFFDDDERVYYLVFIVPKGIEDDCEAFMENYFRQAGEKKLPYAILPCDEIGFIKKEIDYRWSKSNNPKRRSLTLEEKYKFTYYGCVRYNEALRKRKEVF